MHSSGSRTRSALRAARVATALLAAGCAGCNWIALAEGAARYPTTGAGAAANVVIDGATAYVSRAAQGVEVIALPRALRGRLLPPPAGSGSIDDVAVADGLLFALDARPPGHLSVFSLADPLAPVLTAGPVPVAVGPFSGVSAAGGHVVVSGGTAHLALHTYDRQGGLGPQADAIDLGRGQPDVLLAADGRRAFVSTHYWGPYFGLTLLAIDPARHTLAATGRVDVESFGFTAGGAKPASFPIEAAPAGGLLAVAHAPGLALVAVEPAERPRIVSRLAVGVAAVNVDVHGHAAAVVGSSPIPRLVLVDLSDPHAPAVRHTEDLPQGSRATSVAISATAVVVAAHDEGTLVFSRQDWSLRPEGRWK